jgi:hypothetical protein
MTLPKVYVPKHDSRDCACLVACQFEETRSNRRAIMSETPSMLPVEHEAKEKYVSTYHDTARGACETYTSRRLRPPTEYSILPGQTPALATRQGKQGCQDAKR